MIYLLVSIISLAVGATVAYLIAVNKKDREIALVIAQREVAHAQTEAAKSLIEQMKDSHSATIETELKLVREQLAGDSEKILLQRQEQLKQTNMEQLSAILNPLKENISRMREAVEKSDKEQTVTMKLLDERIKENLLAARAVGERADRLANALTSENKTQGNFGEMRLKQLLEDMGFVEGEQFEQQVTTHNDSGSKLVPDVVLHFPDKRDVVIDSKVSLKAFYDHHTAPDEAAKSDALKRHILSLRTHINELSRKNYASYLRKDHKQLDFVFMYVFSDGALQLALSQEPSLSRDAYNQGVIIAGTQSLYMMLRVLEMTWKQVRQFENQQEIMKTAGEIVERVQIYYERVLKVEEQLNRTHEAFNELRNITRSDGRSITTSASKLLKYGAKESPRHKPLPPDFSSLNN